MATNGSTDERGRPLGDPGASDTARLEAALTHPKRRRPGWPIAHDTGAKAAQPLDLRRIGREKQHLDPLRKRERGTRVPPCAIEHQQDLFASSCSHLLCKHLQNLGEYLCMHAWQEQPPAAPAFGIDKGRHIHPLITRGYWSHNRRSLWCPDPPQNGFEADAMLIHAPPFDALVRMGWLHGLNLLGQFSSKPGGPLDPLWRAADEARANCLPPAGGNPIRVGERSHSRRDAASTEPPLVHSTGRHPRADLGGLLPVPAAAQPKARAGLRRSHGDDLGCLLSPRCSTVG